MAYTPEERLRMERLLEAFGGFLAAAEDIDVAYSEKTGYVRLIVAEDADRVFFPIHGYDDMLQMFFYDVLCQEVEFAIARNPALTNSVMDYRVPHRRLLDILDAVGPDREYARRELEKFIEYWKQQKLLP